MIQNLFAILFEGYTNAIEEVTASGEAAVTNLGFALTKGTLVLEIDLYPDGAIYGEFFDTDEVCWDHCNGITNRHRGTYCRFKPEHADLDCGCNEGYYQSLADAYEDEQDALAAMDDTSFDPPFAEAFEDWEMAEEPF